MKNSVEILNELMAISPLLAGLEKVNVYAVPEGYFDKLEERISDFAIYNSINESVFDKANVQKVPEGYFDSLSTNILAKIKGLHLETASEELQNLSPVLLSLKDENIFKVPEGYFDSLSASILAEIKKPYAETANEELQNLSPVLFYLKSENVFKVPEGYFDSLSTNILTEIKKSHAETANEELQNLSPVLLSLKKENVFKVSEGYFENFAGTVTSKLKPVTAKVIVMKPRNSWLRIAAAAVVTGAIAISSLNIFNHSSNQDNTGTLVAANSTVMPAYVKESFQFKTEQEVDAGIARLSDDDIIKYLEKNGNVTDNELLMKNTDVSELPSQTDYLMDENTLNTYLDKIDAESKTN
ncbi:MAG: hypothetical protein ABI594_11585 [Ginsengibacter sp.]